MLNNKTGREPLFHLVKRDNMPKWQAWLIRGGAVVLALLVSAVVSAILTDGASFGYFFKGLFDGVFGTERRILIFFQNAAILLCIALAVTPAFKMKFWNIGAEGQVLMGGLACVVCIQYLGGKIDESALLIIMAASSIVASIVWTVIPAIFKAKWNTNETLFTLMMNYVAMQIVACCAFEWDDRGYGILGILEHGHFPKLGGYDYIINIIIVVLLVVFMFIYFRFSKHGYELSVVGESENTAKYIGINVKKVIIRTMILSGAICGVAGLLLVAGTNHTIANTTVGGRGFTAILVSWLGQFSPLTMSFTSMLYTFIDQGAKQVATNYDMSAPFSAIITGIFFFFIIGCEFFINYKIKFRSFKKKSTDTPAVDDGDNIAAQQVENEEVTA